MSILGKFLGGKRDYPLLDSSTPAAKQLESVRPPLEKLANETKDPLEVVPAEDSVYIFLGKPPKKFGIEWIEEGDKIDLLSMGRPEGQGCYCAINHLLREIIDNLNKHYPYVVIDNEAGMEHISRRTTRDVDVLLLVSDPTVRGIKTAGEMIRLAEEVEVNVNEIKLIMNRVPDGLPSPLLASVEELGLEIAALIPADEKVNQLDALGEPLTNLDGDSPAWRAVHQLTGKLFD